MLLAALLFTTLAVQQPTQQPAAAPKPKANAAQQARAIFEQKTIRLRLDLGLGRSEAVVWTCDLSPDYVRINSDYTS